ncbi:unnamed protein product [Caenorhabditis angaria]|uniref:Uncharacterized protein n=1 Tax=Caenorhabditis angaria TaxID=860376 RepID=A0A9P1J299_9PELO|nr:unnamed protein product [Caenorhabditis angaria]
MSEQRLVQLEVHASRLAEINKNLRDNFERVQEDIEKLMENEKNLMNLREKQLKQDLLRLFLEKEELIVGQQLEAYNAIGACRQSIKQQHSAVPPTSFNFLEKELREPQIALRIDDAILRRRNLELANFGAILCEEKPSKVEGTLNFFVEKYEAEEEHFDLMYKSCDEKIWLKKEISEEDAQSETSSFEIISEKTNMSNLEKPMEYWLAEKSVADNLMAENEWDFGRVIRSLQNSDDRKWIMENGASSSKTETGAETETEAENVEMEMEEETRKLSEFEMIEQLTKMFGKSFEKSKNGGKMMGIEDLNAWRNVINPMVENRNWLNN